MHAHLPHDWWDISYVLLLHIVSAFWPYIISRQVSSYCRWWTENWGPCCGIFRCRNPLENNRRRFCKDHSDFHDVCAVVGCDQPVLETEKPNPTSVPPILVKKKTCSLEIHQKIEAIMSEALGLFSISNAFNTRKSPSQWTPSHLHYVFLRMTSRKILNPTWSTGTRFTCMWRRIQVKWGSWTTAPWRSHAPQILKLEIVQNPLRHSLYDVVPITRRYWSVRVGSSSRVQPRLEQRPSRTFSLCWRTHSRF